jgi:integrase
VQADFSDARFLAQRVGSAVNPRTDTRNIPTTKVSVERFIRWLQAEGDKDIPNHRSVLLGSDRVIGRKASGPALARSELGGLRVSRVTQWDLSGWFEDRHEESGPATRRRGRASLRKFIKYCANSRWMDQGMLEFFPALPKPDSERTWLHPEQVVALEELMWHERFDDYDRFSFHALLDTGVRPSELIKFREGDLDPREHMLRVRGKGRADGKLRFVPVGEAFEQRWHAHVRRYGIRPGGWMFFHRAPRFVGGRSGATEWETDLKRHITQRPLRRLLAHEEQGARKVSLQDLANERLRANLAPRFPLTPYVFRRTYACMAMIAYVRDPSSGMDVKSLMEALGHASLDTTQLYLADVERYLGTKRTRFDPLVAARRAVEG